MTQYPALWLGVLAWTRRRAFAPAKEATLQEPVPARAAGIECSRHATPAPVAGGLAVRAFSIRLGPARRHPPSPRQVVEEEPGMAHCNQRGGREPH
jgi:hypothetical protein